MFNEWLHTDAVCTGSHCPGIVGRSCCNSPKLIGAITEVWTRDAAPSRTVPMLDEGLSGSAVISVSDGPDVVGRNCGNPPDEVIQVSIVRVCAGNDVPTGAIPVLNERLGVAVAVPVRSRRPDIVRGKGRYS